MRAYDEVQAALTDSGVEAGAALAALARLPEVRAELDRCEAALIEAARDGGAGWAAIATSLGLASRQAGEQRLARLRRRVPGQRNVDDLAAVGDAVRALAAAVSGDDSWNRRAPRAALARECLEIAAGLGPDDPPGGLFSLARDVLDDLSTVAPASLSKAQRTALARLRRAFTAAQG